MSLEPPDRQRGFKKERMLRVLLQHPDGDLSRYRVAKETEASEPWVHEYLDRLEDRGIVKGTEVLDFHGMFEEWLEVRVEPSRLEVSFQEPLELVQGAGLDYALTTYKAEQYFSNQLFSRTADFYIHPDDCQEWERIVEEEGLVGGGNSTILVSDEHVFYENQVMEGLRLVSTAQLILDLLSEGGPAVEAATTIAQKQYTDSIVFTGEEKRWSSR